MSDVYIKPAVEYVARLGEMFLLVAAFRLAAAQVHSIALNIMAFLMSLALGGWIGIGWGKLFWKPLSRVRIKTPALFWAVGIVGGAVLGLFWFGVSREIGAVVADLVKANSAPKGK